MSYRRDNQVNEQIPLPIETVYNSIIDSIKIKDKNGNQKYFNNGDKHFNRIYFKYPPEWNTSNIGEKIIGIRNIITKWRDGELNFTLYIRQISKQKLLEMIANIGGNKENKMITDNLSLEEKIEIAIDNLNKDGIMLYRIPITIKVTADDNWVDIKDQIIKYIDNKNIYNHLKNKIIKREITTDERLRLLNVLEEIKNDYNSMIEKSNELIGEQLSFYLKSSDISVIVEYDENNRYLSITSKDSDSPYLFDFLMTRIDPVLEIRAIEYFYDGPYSLNRNLHLVDDQYKIILKDAADIDDEIYHEIISMSDEEKYQKIQFESYTACFFNIGSFNPYKNSIEYVTHYQNEFKLNNLMTDLQCEVAASFASQSNHNLIGRTNEKFTPIKYFKLNDNDDKFWIEFYDKNEIKIPLAINDNVVFTMDMVFLQNRKLLYS